MEEESAAIRLDIDLVPWGGQEFVVSTSHGPISVLVCGDQDKPALVTYPDVGLNYLSCFEGLFSCTEAASVLFHNFCIYHIDAPGHEVGACEIPTNQALSSVDDLADQVAEVLDYFGLQEVIGLGVAAGAYILTLFALKYRERMLGLILVSPLCQTACWTEWLYNKAMINLLYFCGMSKFVKETLLQRYFSQEVRNASNAGLDVVRTYRRLLDERQSKNVMRFIQAIHLRVDLSEGLKKLKCRTLIIVGEHSPFHHEAVHISKEMDRRYNVLVEVQACGSLVTQEQPHSMIVPIELFLIGYGFYQDPHMLFLRHPPVLLVPLVSHQNFCPQRALGLS